MKALEEAIEKAKKANGLTGPILAPAECWEKLNPILPMGIIGMSRGGIIPGDPDRLQTGDIIKVGDGTTAWNDLELLKSPEDLRHEGSIMSQEEIDRLIEEIEKIHPLPIDVQILQDHHPEHMNNHGMEYLPIHKETAWWLKHYVRKPMPDLENPAHEDPVDRINRKIIWDAIKIDIDKPFE